MYAKALKRVSFLSLALHAKGTNFILSMENTLKSIKSLKSLTQQSSQEWQPMVKLVKSRLKECQVVITNFDEVLESCNTDVLADLKWLDQKIREHLEWSDIELLRAIIVFVETKCWLPKEVIGEHDEIDDPDEISDEIRQAVECTINIFWVPLEAKGAKWPNVLVLC